jgi:NDMA-dependent alcohol dehydrogenase
MHTRGAVIAQVPGSYQTIDLILDEVRQGELLVRMVAAGLCHSDDHIATGDFPVGLLPMCGGHEGAGVVERVGPHTIGFEIGDHVVFSFVPGCGRCRWCATGHQNLCDLGASTLDGSRPADGTFRMTTAGGDPVGQMAGISTFSERTIAHVNSAIKVPQEFPLEKLCLLGCSVGTGWGAAVNSAEVAPGQTVIVVGVGGIGCNAVQGAAIAGASHIIAVDPVLMKREMALEVGATRAVADIAEATDIARSLTNGQGADSAIVAVGVINGTHVAEAFSAIRKAGTVVVVGLGDYSAVGVPISLSELTLYQKRIQGSLFGASSPSWDILRQIELYRDGKLKIDQLITRNYSLDQIAQGYTDLHAGETLRGVVLFDS